MKTIKGILSFTNLYLLICIPVVISFNSKIKQKITTKVLDPSVKSLNNVIVHQAVSHNSISYESLTKNVILFVQNSTKDKHKAVIILKAGEDRLIHSSQNKQTYVVLRRKQKTNIYSVLIAYIRFDAHN